MANDHWRSGTSQTRNLADEVSVALRSRQAQAITVGERDQELWDALARMADLHRPVDTDLRLPPVLQRCTECTGGAQPKVWPCQTLRLLAEGLGVGTGRRLTKG